MQVPGQFPKVSSKTMSNHLVLRYGNITLKGNFIELTPIKQEDRHLVYTYAKEQNRHIKKCRRSVFFQHHFKLKIPKSRDIKSNQKLSISEIVLVEDIIALRDNTVIIACKYLECM